MTSTECSDVAIEHPRPGIFDPIPDDIRPQLHDEFVDELSVGAG